MDGGRTPSWSAVALNDDLRPGAALGCPLDTPSGTPAGKSAVLLGVSTVVFASGPAMTPAGYDGGRTTYDVTVYVGSHHDGKEVLPTHGDRAIQSLLEGLPGAAHVIARSDDEALIR
ncbi:hypothetical protein JS756_06040 [Streptomyces actuosus]|uniref:Uncharacterized protein n=1 Tax=Streptomyces actuosus TaxID=1885 RepID=A0ABS2VKP2_STRAS|nr:hypothetical protein [Streptomyces actuosus]MBN0043672.1 hypothetical protein [Streptomyces actuosus]